MSIASQIIANGEVVQDQNGRQHVPFSGKYTTVSDLLATEARAPIEIATGVEGGLYSATDYHLRLASVLSDAELTNAPDLWEGFDQHVGELWRTVASLGEQLMVSRLVANDPVLADKLADKIFTASENFGRQVANFLQSAFKGKSSHDQIIDMYQEAIEENQVIAALLSQHEEANYMLNQPKGYVTMLAQGIFRPFLFANGRQFFHSKGVRTLGKVADIANEYEAPANIAGLTLIALEANEISGMQELLQFAKECHGENPLELTAPKAQIGPKIVLLQAQELPWDEPSSSPFPTYEVRHLTLEEPLASFGDKYGEVFGAVLTRDALVVQVEKGLLECDTRGYDQPYSWGKVKAFNADEYYADEIGFHPSALSTTGAAIVGKRIDNTSSHPRPPCAEVNLVNYDQRIRYGTTIENCPPYESIQAIEQVAWSGDDSVLALASKASPRVLITTASAGSRILALQKLEEHWRVCKGYGLRGTSIALNGDGSLVAILSASPNMDEELIQRTPDCEARSFHLFDTKTGEQLIGDKPRYEGGYAGDTLNPTDEQLATILKNREEVEGFEQDLFRQVFIGEDDKIFILNSKGAVTALFTKETDPRGFTSWERTKELPDFGLNDDVRTNITVSPDRSLFACIADNGSRCEVLSGNDLSLRQTVARNPEHDGKLTYVRFSPNGTQLILTDENGNIWEVDAPES